MTATMTKAASTIALPKGVKESDLKYPSYKSKKRVVHTLTMYYTQRFGWVITTLHISKGRRMNADRSYAISLNGTMCRVGNGPHVQRTITVYVTDARQKALQHLIDLETKGAIHANEKRDSISTNRMNARARRSMSFWGL